MKCPFVCCGVPRSGSTLVWQTLQAVFPEHDVPQDHPGCFEPDGETIAVVTLRDPRDVAGSRYRVRLSRDPESGGMDGLNSELVYMAFTFEGIKKILEGPSCLLRYEEFWLDRDVIYAAIEKTLGRVVIPEVRAAINMDTSLSVNKRRADQLESFREFDQESRIHGDHIFDPYPGGWKTTLPEWAIPRVDEFCKELVKEWGYETC